LGMLVAVSVLEIIQEWTSVRRHSVQKQKEGKGAKKKRTRSGLPSLTETLNVRKNNEKDSPKASKFVFGWTVQVSVITLRHVYTMSDDTPMPTVCLTRACQRLGERSTLFSCLHALMCMEVPKFRHVIPAEQESYYDIHLFTQLVSDPKVVVPIL
jgi:hypothetical protein